MRRTCEALIASALTFVLTGEEPTDWSVEVEGDSSARRGRFEFTESAVKGEVYGAPLSGVRSGDRIEVRSGPFVWIGRLDGNEITGRRTAAASALAGDYLARRDAARLLVVGSGHVAVMMAQAWASVRPIRTVEVWNRRAAGAAALAARLRAEGFEARAVTDLEAAVGRADVVSCATLAEAPLVKGAWLRPGCHLDLIGGYRPDMREADDAAVARARVFIDTEAALAEAGDLTQPMASGVLRREGVEGDLFALCRGAVAGRRGEDDITLFKSVGSAIEDLAAAALVWGDVSASHEAG
jgi:ornithine cyclodeaminase